QPSPVGKYRQLHVDIGNPGHRQIFILPVQYFVLRSSRFQVFQADVGIQDIGVVVNEGARAQYSQNRNSSWQVQACSSEFFQILQAIFQRLQDAAITKDIGQQQYHAGNASPVGP